MLIESYTVGFSEVKHFLSSLKQGDFVVVSENIFMLKDKNNALHPRLADLKYPRESP